MSICFFPMYGGTTNTVTDRLKLYTSQAKPNHDPNSVKGLNHIHHLLYHVEEKAKCVNAHRSESSDDAHFIAERNARCTGFQKPKTQIGAPKEVLIFPTDTILEFKLTENSPAPGISDMSTIAVPIQFQITPTVNRWDYLEIAAAIASTALYDNIILFTIEFPKSYTPYLLPPSASWLHLPNSIEFEFGILNKHRNSTTNANAVLVRRPESPARYCASRELRTAPGELAS
ncbi:uncharacterized protein FOMMEDRAFT_150238 [Fomitiporia mediterranea MF3/22]|uniref:uncharacterized protein n=1 Tax=Fomitiporia mediterranea (strain MF3/22) TaxID=694068 RepID=UPI00044088E0|nr:uncharacterized protein FOMMEDRAFT_150238 [Fomitiporia mediterranea MF3/22]EJD07695.1 hypothetical protein FOMMEDRAFT_150238 [Fomitiporia mediterranea MF3/22]